MKLVKITEFADIERAKKDKTYKTGSILVALSATDEDVLILKSNEKISSRYAVINTKEGLISYYLYIVLQDVFPKFLHAHRTGINLQIDQLQELAVPLLDLEKQKSIVNTAIALDNQIEAVSNEIEMYKSMKEYYLEKLFL